jgi:hypothetical protein
MLTERLEVRIDEQTIGLLREAAERRGVSMGEIVRRAVEALLVEEDRAARLAAVEELCSFELPVEDWETMEEEYLASIDERLP